MIKKISLLVSLVFVVLASRFLPHPPNFTPVLSLALFSGVLFKERWILALFTLISLFVSDYFLGFSEITPVIYITFFIIAFMGPFVLKNDQISYTRLSLGSVLASLLFFLVTNFAVWQFTDLYQKTSQGLWLCYVSAIPFFHNTLVSTFIYSFALFAFWSIAHKTLGSLASQKAKVG